MRIRTAWHSRRRRVTERKSQVSGKQDADRGIDVEVSRGVMRHSPVLQSSLVSAFGIAITLSAWAATAFHDLSLIRYAVKNADYARAAEGAVFLGLVTGLVYGSLVYLLARYMCDRRVAAHRCASDADLAEFRTSGSAPEVTILVPSYKENPQVVRKTLLSAALQDYPRRAVVLLIDDPPVPATIADRRALDAVRRIPRDIESLLAPWHARTSAALDAFDRCPPMNWRALESEGRLAVQLLRDVAQWFMERARGEKIHDHSDELFVELTFRQQAERYADEAETLSLRIDRADVDRVYLRALYQRLAQQFNVGLSLFERKRYVNLSHEPNKAMNLNSYIGLMGGRFRERGQQGERLLEADDAGPISVADSELLVVLDADSILHPEYTLRLAQRLGQRKYRRVAVIQTPYSSFPGARSLVERVAGATTDIQYQLHQGFTGWDATFWVGANAMVRKQALQEIAETREERGFQIRTFIHDRTVIEDTESTIDLRARGWQLDNYPERLAFSATPPDFGALLIQRRRWANGGLLILPKLWRYCLRGDKRGAAVIEAFFRFHYLTSLAIVNVALLTLLAFSFDDRMASAWLPVTAVPYYLLYASDLRRIGYRRRDVLRIYALNLLLIPVNLGGVLKSLHQACTGRRSSFGRTPKVPGRTAAPVGYIVAEFVLLSWWTFGAVMELDHGRWLNSVFGAVNVIFLLYAIIRFIGARQAREDLRPLWTNVALLLRSLSPPRKLLRIGARVYPVIALVMVLLSPDPARGVDLAVTVDDLPTHGPLPAGLTREAVADLFIAVLKKHRVPGVVGFVNAGQIEVVPAYTGILQRWVEAGYLLGNHTLNHTDIDRSPAQDFLVDVDRNDRILATYGGADARLFRYPYLHEGNTLAKRRAIRVALRDRGYEVAQVTVDFYDWAWNAPYAACVAGGNLAAVEVLKRTFLGAAVDALSWADSTALTLVRRPVKQILLLHLGAFDALMLDELLTAYELRGVRFIPVQEAIADAVYGIDPDVPWGDQRNFLGQLLQATGRLRTRAGGTPASRHELGTLCPVQRSGM
jgi:cellulose synthase/poly-beta-1,6-N-acetylglucosamine synthase-like glycosyltransferase/peptidoglycan/xylan/chitin deacetylase (PgdA/CDA1 family)